MDEVANHFRIGQVVEQAQHALEQESVLTTAHLLGDDDARMGSPHGLPLLVERSEVTNVECEDGSTTGTCEGELFFVRRGVPASFFSCQNIITAAAQVRS